MSSSRFVVMKHEAKRAGLHFDLRFQIPGSHMWASFAVRKGVPLEEGIKVLAIRTEDHSEKGALLTGRIGSGYGAGKLTKWDWGYCDVEKYTVTHIVLNCRGNKVKGIYHLLNTRYTLTKVSDSEDKQSYMLFKGKVVKEVADMMGSGMTSRNPPAETQEVELNDEDADKQQKKSLPWSKGENAMVNKISIKEVQSLVELEEVSLLIDDEERKLSKLHHLDEIFVQTSEIENMNPGRKRDMQILRLGMIAELDASNLYEKLAELSSNDMVKKTLLDVSQEEKVHAGEFESLLNEVDPEHEKSIDQGKEEVETEIK